MSKTHHQAFTDMGEGIDFEGVMKTITWDENIDIKELLTDVILNGNDRKGMVIYIDIHGGTKLEVKSQCMIDFERKYHYLSKPDRIREASKSMLGIKGIVSKIVPSTIDSVCDYSGRMGVSSAILKSILKPEIQYINEAEISWIPHLKMNFPKELISNLPFKESFTTLPRSDVALLDYCSFNPARDFEGIIPALEIGHECIILTDATPFMWHLNRNAYTKGFFTAPEKHSDYVRKFSNYLSENYGYVISYTIKRGTVCNHLIEKGARKYDGVIKEYSDEFSTQEKGFSIHISVE